MFNSANFRKLSLLLVLLAFVTFQARAAAIMQPTKEPTKEPAKQPAKQPLLTVLSDASSKIDDASTRLQDASKQLDDAAAQLNEAVQAITNQTSTSAQPTSDTATEQQDMVPRAANEDNPLTSVLDTASSQLEDAFKSAKKAADEATATAKQLYETASKQGGKQGGNQGGLPFQGRADDASGNALTSVLDQVSAQVDDVIKSATAPIDEASDSAQQLYELALKQQGDNPETEEMKALREVYENSTTEEWLDHLHKLDLEAEGLPLTKRQYGWMPTCDTTHVVCATLFNGIQYARGPAPFQQSSVPYGQTLSWYYWQQMILFVGNGGSATWHPKGGRSPLCVKGTLKGGFYNEQDSQEVSGSQGGQGWAAYAGGYNGGAATAGYSGGYYESCTDARYDPQDADVYLAYQ